MLTGLIKQGIISEQQSTAIAESNLIEILFDLYQAAVLSGAAIHLSHRPLPTNLLPPVSTSVSASRVFQQAQQLWQTWQESELTDWSPNLAPVIWDNDALRQQMSFLAYHNLTMLVDGDRTLRDIAIQLKQPLVPLTRSLMPYVQKGIMGLTAVKDWGSDRSFKFTQSGASSANSPGGIAQNPIASTHPLVAYIEDSRFDSVAMNQIVTQAGYQFVNIQDPIEALPILLEQKPSLIFLDLLMPVTNGYEVCTQIRRISAFKDTPVIIVTGKDGIVDRVRAKLVGSSDFIAKPIEPGKVLSVLKTYLSAR
ncbi:response regulator [Leptolyngbya ohadii]|uniref:response regulator n=1 Tax=Leptolyngbya ohadii TaxID=1962290 RepID=UPI0015C5E2C0|nr:response regulator [Leptolyngbya ohadii]